jgi:hypothetical protein
MSNKFWTRSGLTLAACFLAVCGTGDATTIQRQTKQEDAPLRLVIRTGSEDIPEFCEDFDPMRLVVFEGNREILYHDYCSAYGLGEARLVTDALGKHFVLLEHGEGRGNRSTSMYLTIFELDLDTRGFLNERARLLVSEPVGLYVDSTYRYDVATPARGGIRLTGNWTMAREYMHPDELRVAPVRNRMVLEIDHPPSPAG